MLSQLLPLYATFVLISLSGALSPGPLTALSISEGARAGRWSGTRLALGHGLVEIPLVFAIAFGLGAWLRQPLVGGLIALVGAGVLLWMGYGLTAGALQGRLTLAGAAAGPTPAALRFGHIPGGVVFTLTNPYWSLWWATLGASYVARVMAPAGTALVVPALAVGGLALSHWVTDLAWLGGLSLLVASGRGVIGERGYRIVLLGCGIFLIVFGCFFAWSGLGVLRQL
jgi:threonine/homoserine/homoserine lactone efflux protein